MLNLSKNTHREFPNSSAVSTCPNLDSPNILLAKIESIIVAWQSQIATKLTSREYRHLLGCVLVSLQQYAPKVLEETAQVSAALFPRYQPNEQPAAFIFVNDGVNLSFLETQFRFRDFVPYLLKARVQKIAERSKASSGLLIPNFKTLRASNDWVSPESSLVNSWLKIFTQILRAKGESCGIKILQNKEVARGLAGYLLPIFQSQIADAFKSLVIIPPCCYVKEKVLLPERETGLLGTASRLASQAQRVAVVQFLLTAPFFSTSIAAADRDVGKTILETVMERKPLLHESAKLLDCSEALVGRLRACSLSTLSNLIENSLPDYGNQKNDFKNIGLSYRLITRFLRSVPISNIPNFEKESLQSKNLAALAKVFSAAIQLAFPDPQATRNDKNGVQSKADLFAIEALGAKTYGRWILQAKQLTQKRMEALGHVRDMVNAISRVSILPQMLRDRAAGLEYPGTLTPEALMRVARALTLTSLAQQTGILGILKLSDQWHRSGSSNFLGKKRYIWPDLVPTVKAPNGCSLVPLSSSSALAEEGTIMHHCVGSYELYCVQGHSRIYSVQDADNQRLSTLEIQIKSEGSNPTIHMRQNRSYFNDPAPEAAEEAANWFIDGVNEGSLIADWKALHSASAKRAGDDLCGFDLYDDAAWLDEYKAIKTCLPTAIAADSPEEFLVRINLKNLISNCFA